MTFRAPVTTTLNVGKIPGRERHRLILGRFVGLAPIEALLLADGRDPKPLFFPVKAQSRGELTCDFVPGGPAVWRTRTGVSEPGAGAVAQCCTQCGRETWAA